MTIAGLMLPSILAMSIIVCSGTPLISAARLTGYSITFAFSSSKFSQFSSTNFLSYRSSLMRTFMTPFMKAMSEPTLSCANMSA